MSRCLCCDAALKPSEIIWYPEEERHEELCSRCKGDILKDCFEIGWDTERRKPLKSRLSVEVSDGSD